MVGALSDISAGLYREVAVDGAVDPVEYQHALEEGSLLKYGREVGMDEAKLKTALTKHTHLARVLDAKKIGVGVNVESTPTIYVNGRWPARNGTSPARR